MPEKIKKYISEHLFFHELTNEEKDILVKCAHVKEFNEDEFIIGTHEEAKHFYLILSGTAGLSIFSHEYGKINVETIQEGDFLGWSWLVRPNKYHFDVVAQEKVKTLAFDTKELRKEMEHNHLFGYKIYKIFTPIIVERLQTTILNVMNNYKNLNLMEINL
ncbi:MAG: cyclic nucleotide-binding domain-containing protein [Candidatus Sericytochromatia bacterium]